MGKQKNNVTKRISLEEKRKKNNTTRRYSREENQKRKNRRKRTSSQKKEKTHPFWTYFPIGLLFVCLGAYFSSNLFTLFDTFAAFIFILNVVNGARHGIQDFFSFSSTIIAFSCAVFGYHWLYETTQITFGTGNPISGRIGFFMILLVGSWFACQYASYALLKAKKKLPKILWKGTYILGAITGMVRGLIFLYMLVAILRLAILSKFPDALSYQESLVHKFGTDLNEKYEVRKKIENAVIMEVRRVIGKAEKE